MKNKVIGLVVLSLISSGAFAAKDEKRALDIAFVDSFQTMRECDEGKAVGKELENMREKISNEIREQAQKVALREKELQGKASTMKKELFAQQEREIARQKRSLEDDVREAEETLKVTMQSKTEKLAAKVEEGIVEVAKEKGVDAVIDKMTGRVIYTKEDNRGDITAEAIVHVNRRAAKTDKKDSTVVAKKDSKQAAVAA